MFRRAQYCPAPAGDSITRKSIFDSLLAGCVPVIFARATMSQYLWFFTEEEMTEVSVYMPKQMIMEENANFLDILKAITPEELLKKQLAIERIASRLQYSLVCFRTFILPIIMLIFVIFKVPERINGDRGDVWDSPVRDAADVIIEKILDRKTIEPLNGFGEQDLIQQKCMQNDIMQNHADYAGLFAGKSRGEVGSHISNRIWSRNKCDTYSREQGFNGSTFTVTW